MSIVFFTSYDLETFKVLWRRFSTEKHPYIIWYTCRKPFKRTFHNVKSWHKALKWTFFQWRHSFKEAKLWNKTKHTPKKKAFFLTHTAHLSNSASQLVLFHHLFCICFWGVHFRVHSRWGPFPCSLLGEYTSMFTSREGGPLPCLLLGGSTSVLTSGGGGSTSVFTSRGVHFCIYFQGSHVTYPIILLYTAIGMLSWAKFTWDPPQVRQTDRQTQLKTLPSHTLCMQVVIMSNLKVSIMLTNAF